MRSAISGDGAVYHRLLKAIAPVLRAAARRGLARAGQPVDQAEDIVQDILLAVHLKRHTWDANAPFAPWLFAIARNKLIDALRRRGRRVFVNIRDCAETLPGEAAAETVSASEGAARLESLPARQRAALQSIAADSAPISDSAAKYSMRQDAVRRPELARLHERYSGDVAATSGAGSDRRAPWRTDQARARRRHCRPAVGRHCGNVLCLALH